jgi:hypothetical protein
MGRAKRQAGHETPRQAQPRAGRRPHARDVAEPAAARAARPWADQAWLHALDPLNAVLARALLIEHEAATAILAGGRTAATVRALVEHAFASTRTTTEALLRRTPPAGQPACRAGCAFCCAIPVSVHPAATRSRPSSLASASASRRDGAGRSSSAGPPSAGACF